MIFPEFTANRVKGCLILITTLCLSLQLTSSQELPENMLRHYVCNNTDCRETALAILSYGNFNVDPCDDFYKYSCGEYLGSLELKPHVHSYSHITTMEELTRQRIRDLLEEKVTDNDELLEIKAKMIHSSCMDTAKADRHGTDFLENLLRNAGGWPMIKDSRDRVRHMDWEYIHKYFHTLSGVGSLIDVLVYGDYFTNNTPTIHLDQPATVCGPYSYIIPKDSETYTRFLIDLATDFIRWTGSDASLEEVNRQVVELTGFRQSLVNIMSWGETRRNESRKNNHFTFEGWQQMSDAHAATHNYTNLNWLQFVNDTFGENIPLRSSQNIIVSEVNYFPNLLHLLQQTPKRIILNHIFLHFIERHLKYMTTNLTARANKLKEDIMGIPAVAERWKVCLVENPLQHVMARMYTKRYFPENSTHIVGRIVEDIRISLINQINMSPWMQIPTKGMALKKLRKLKVMIGYPEFYNNETVFNSLYDGLAVGHNNLLNALAYGQHEFRLKALTLIGREYDNDIESLPTEVNGFYDFYHNSLQLNAAILQWPIYTPHLPDVVLYATLGNLIGHEMGHAFDTIGRYFDENGTSYNWWDRTSNQKFNEKIECIVRQYNNYRINVEDMTLAVNGRNTASENIADVIGMKASYKAFKRGTRRLPFEAVPQLPGLTHYSEEEIFFLASAMVWCERMDSFQIVENIQHDVHSLPPFRVNGPMSNSPEFSTAFNCEAGKNMNPSSKCNIWRM